MDKQLLWLIITIIVAAIVSIFLVLFTSFKAAILGMIIVFVMAISYQYPKQGLWGFLIYLPFAGTVTYMIGAVYNAVDSKVAYSSDYPIFHLAKDGFYFPALLALSMITYCFQEFRNKYQNLTQIMGVFAGCCFLTLLYVNLPQSITDNDFNILLIGLVGLKVLVGYIPLIFCGYWLINSKKDLISLNRLQVGLILICCLLCLMQFIFLKTGICPGNVNLLREASHRASLQAKCFVGGSLLYNPKLQLIRLPGTFVAPWQWGWFLISGSFFAYSESLNDQSLKWRIISIFTLLLLIFITIISGQRIALILVPIILSILILVTDKNKIILPIKFGVIGLISFVIVQNVQLVQERLDSLVGRWDASPPIPFILGQFEWVITRNFSIIGLGVGQTASAARSLGDIKLIETFYANLLYEIGLLGAIVFLILGSILTVVTFKSYRAVKDPELKNIALCLWVFILLISYNTYYYPLMVDPVAVYYWFFAGVLLKIPQLEED
jgi:hypothetical protein